MRLTTEAIAAAVGSAADRAALFADHLADACNYYGINTLDRLAAFLAQIGHESGGLRYVREIASGQAYEGRKDLGNTEPGDGERYRGRGLIQTTGRDNYRRVRDRLQARLESAPDFEATPEALEMPKWAAWSAADYWDMRGLNALADRGDFEAITRKINGGLNGQADRLKRWEKAKAVLVLASSDPGAPQPEPHSASDTYTPAGEGAGPQEPEMTPLLLALGSSLIDIFTPLAKEKITKEVARHTDNPAVAAQIATAAIDTAKAVTGLADPIEAVAAAKKVPTVMGKVEASALDQLAKLAPLLDKMQAHEKEAWAAEEASRDAASRRAADDPNDQDAYLTQSIVRMMVAVFVGLGILAAGLKYLGVDVQAIVGTILTLVGVVGREFSTRFQHRYGSSRGSGTKDIVISELSKRGK